MASYFEMAEGRLMHEQLRAAGGFCWDHRREGSQTISVHMNRGYAMTPELRAALKEHGKALKTYVFETNDQERRDLEALARRQAGIRFVGSAERSGSGAPGVGSSPLPPSTQTASGEVARGN